MWQRYNQTTHIFETSVDNGQTWTMMPIAAANIEGGGPGGGVEEVFVGPADPGSPYEIWFDTDDSESLMFPPNVALTDKANIFTAPQQEISGTAARIILRDTGQIADSRVFRLVNNSSFFTVEALDDALNVVQTQPLKLARNGDATTGRSVYVGLSLYTTGYVFPGYGSAVQVNYYISGNATYGLYSNTGMLFEGSVISGQSVRANTYIAAVHGFQERSRTPYMGDWTAFTPTFVAGASLTGTTTCQYMLIGKTCFILYHLSINIPASTNYFQWVIPFYSSKYTSHPMLYDNAIGMAQTWPAYNSIFCYPNIDRTGAFPAGGYNFGGMLTFEIS